MTDDNTSVEWANSKLDVEQREAVAMYDRAERAVYEALAPGVTKAAEDGDANA